MPGSYDEKSLLLMDNQGVNLKKGDKMGGFNMGSTIVLIFEAPNNFKFSTETGHKIKYGEGIGFLDQDN